MLQHMSYGAGNSLHDCEVISAVNSLGSDSRYGVIQSHGSSTTFFLRVTIAMHYYVNKLQKLVS